MVTIQSASIPAATTSLTDLTSHTFPEWKFDTGPSTHMTDDIGQFECLNSTHGVVRVGMWQFSFAI